MGWPRLLVKLLYIQLKTHPYIEFTDTGTAHFYVDIDAIQRVQVG